MLAHDRLERATDRDFLEHFLGDLFVVRGRALTKDDGARSTAALPHFLRDPDLRAVAHFANAPIVVVGSGRAALLLRGEAKHARFVPDPQTDIAPSPPKRKRASRRRQLAAILPRRVVDV
jgi:hypothetical protein